MKYLSIVFAAVLAGSLAPGAQAESPAQADAARRIEVFRLAGVAVAGQPTVERQGYQVIVYDIDGGQRFEAALNAGLPRDRDGLRAALPRRLREWGGDAAVAARIGAAWRGPLLARSYGLDRHPAVVFGGGRAVVYGTTDVSEALARYLDWSKVQQR